MEFNKEFSFGSNFESDFENLVRSEKDVADRLLRLMIECRAHPRNGIGRPEPLQGYRGREIWSRRIIGKHRLVYEIKKNDIVFLGCYGHYADH